MMSLAENDFWDTTKTQQHTNTDYRLNTRQNSQKDINV